MILILEALGVYTLMLLFVPKLAKRLFKIFGFIILSLVLFYFSVEFQEKTSQASRMNWQRIWVFLITFALAIRGYYFSCIDKLLWCLGRSVR